MLRGLLALTWLEIKIFLREPLGVFATVVVPVAIFLFLGAGLSDEIASDSPTGNWLISVEVPVFASILIALNAVVSIVAIISIYREGGILKRLRATPLRPQTILGAHVIVKLLLTTITLGAMALAGRRLYPASIDIPVLSFVLALLFTTATLLSIGFLIASIIPTARMAQPLASIILYPMVGFSGLFVPLDQLPTTMQAIARAIPLTYAVSLLRGIWQGDAWLAHTGDVAALLVTAAVSTALAAKVFRWE
jgi:ABC-2 type transport system permease protein